MLSRQHSARTAAMGKGAPSTRIGRAARQDDGFTLVELLVVVAIIALLISILMPSLNRAKELARAAVCGANLKSLGLTLHIYANDYSDSLPRHTFRENEPGMRFTAGYEWHRMYFPYISQTWVGRFQDDVAKECPVFDCPSTRAAVWQCGYVEAGSTDAYENAGTKAKRFDYGIWSPIAGRNNDTTLADWTPDQEFASEALATNPWYTDGAPGQQGYNQARVADYYGGYYSLGDHHLGLVNTLYIGGFVKRVDYRPEP